MGNGDLNWIANYIWGIADDVLRDLYVRGKYRDVILPMTVLRRLDAVLEDSKQAVLDMRSSLDKARIVEQDTALRQAAGQAFYNTSKFTLRDLRARANRQQLTADFTAYLDGFSPNVQDILDNFEFRNQISRLVQSRRPGHADREAHLDRHQPEPLAGQERRRLHPASRTRQPRHGLDLRRTGSSVQRGEQRGSRGTLDPTRCRGAHGEVGLPPRRRRDQIRHLPAVRRRLRHWRYAHRGRGNPATTRRRARQEGLHPSLRPGDQRRDLRHLQGRPATQGRRRRRRQYCGWPGAFHSCQRRLHVTRVRLHALQPAIRQKLENGSRTHGRQERHARPALRHRT